MQKNDKVTFHINVDKNLAEQFEQCYPRCRTRLVENLLRCVIQDKELFDRIFFCDLLRKNE